MTSLDDLFYELTPVRYIPNAMEFRMISPAYTLSDLIQKVNLRIDQKILDETLIRDDLIEILGFISMGLYQIRDVLDRYNDSVCTDPSCLSDHLRVILNQMDESLDHHGVVIINPIGKRLEEVQDATIVEGWLPSEQCIQEQVLETIEPIVFSRTENRVIRKGRVIMGSPARDTRRTS